MTKRQRIRQLEEQLAHQYDIQYLAGKIKSLEKRLDRTIDKRLHKQSGEIGYVKEHLTLLEIGLEDDAGNVVVEKGEWQLYRIISEIQKLQHAIESVRTRLELHEKGLTP
jgi:hypothetical protein